MTTSTKNRVGCAVIALALVGAVIAGGLWLGRRDAAAKTPCQRYAQVVQLVLDNCHSGQDRDPDHNIAVCEKIIDATPDCLERISALTCNEIESGLVTAAGSICRASN